MGNRQKELMFSLIAAGMMMSPQSNQEDGYSPEQKEAMRKAILKAKLEKKEKMFINSQIKKGLKYFTFGDNGLWALNYKNALRKAKKKGYV